MSDLIAKIVKASVGRSCAWDMSSPYGTPELSGPYFGFQQQQHRNSCNSNSPISGRLCHMWSSCCFRRRKTLSIQAPHGPGDPIQRPTKLARMETYNPRKFSWVPTRGSSVSGTGDLEVGVPPDMTTPTNTSATVTTNSGSDPTYGRG